MLLLFYGKFDRDGNGYISLDELLYVVFNSGEKFSREEAEELISIFDKNADRSIPGRSSWSFSGATKKLQKMRYQEKTPQMKTLRQQQLCVKNKKSSTCLNNIWNLLHAYLNKRDLHHRHHRNPSQSIRKTKTQELKLSGLQFSY